MRLIRPALKLRVILHANIKIVPGQFHSLYQPPIGRQTAKHRARLLKDKAYLNDVMRRGQEQASRIARRTLSKVYRKVGFYAGE